MRVARLDWIASFTLIAAVVLLYRKVTRLWWTNDAAFLLHIAIVHRLRDYFFGSSMWRSLPARLFTPVLCATFDGELSSFGVSARPFYLVQLGLLVLVALLIFWVSRLALSSGSAFIAALLCVLGAPMCSVVVELMLVHYLESVILAAGAVGIFVIADRRTDRALLLSLASAIFYFGAMLAKEIAVPLPAVLFVFSRRRVRDRFVLLAPHIGAASLYALWRRRELGVWLGGYGWTIRPHDVPALLASVPRTMIGELSGGTAFGIGLLILLVVGILLYTRSARDIAVVLLIFALTIAPILPMSKKIEPRFLLLAWIALALFGTAGFARLRPPRLRVLIFILVSGLAITVNRTSWAREYRSSLRMSDEGRTFLDLAAGDALRDPAVPPAAMGELKWLKEEYLHRAPGAAWFYDDMFLCRPGAPARVFSYVPARREIVRVEGIDQLCAAYRRSIRPNAPLTASFHHEGESLFWSFGPYDEGRYTVVMGDGVQAFDVPRNDGFRLPGVNSMTFRVRYESPDHWVTYSPDLALDFVRSPDLSWHR